jgi:hypothetical protein
MLIGCDQGHASGAPLSRKLANASQVVAGDENIVRALFEINADLHDWASGDHCNEMDSFSRRRRGGAMSLSRRLEGGG